MDAYEKVIACAEKLRTQFSEVPSVAVVLGSGLGKFVDKLRKETVIDYSDIFGVSATVNGHAGNIVSGKLCGKDILIMNGRIHYYEGYDVCDAVLPIRTVCALGVRNIVLTNAAGSISQSLKKGDVMLIKDHISSFMPSPLRGKNCENFGTRFPAMTEVYDRELGDKAKISADETGIHLKEGVYVQLQGPQYETPAEIKMLSLIGADAVGMSTVIEVIAARHMGAKVCALSHITNMAAGIEDKALSHDDIQNCNSDDFCCFLENFLNKIV